MEPLRWYTTAGKVVRYCWTLKELSKQTSKKNQTFHAKPKLSIVVTIDKVSRNNSQIKRKERLDHGSRRRKARLSKLIEMLRSSSVTLFPFKRTFQTL